MEYKIAAVQMSSTAHVDDNLEQAKQLIARAAKAKAQCVVLPEMFALMGKTDQDKLAHQEHFGSGKIQDFLATQASHHKIWIVGGTIPIGSGNENKVYASSLVFDDNGECVARYDKMHLFKANLSKEESYNEGNTVEAGKEQVVIDTPFGKLGLAVCYDLRFSDFFRHLFYAGAEIIAVPSAFTMVTGKAHWSILLRGRAIEHFFYIVGAGQTGNHASGRETYGHSMIVDPWGAILANAYKKPGLIYGYIDPAKVQEMRARIDIS